MIKLMMYFNSHMHIEEQITNISSTLSSEIDKCHMKCLTICSSVDVRPQTSLNRSLKTNMERIQSCHYWSRNCLPFCKFYVYVLKIVVCPLFFWPVCCLSFFDLQILITFDIFKLFLWWTSTIRWNISHMWVTCMFKNNKVIDVIQHTGQKNKGQKTIYKTYTSN
jgi:hypothetical protein